MDNDKPIPMCKKPMTAEKYQGALLGVVVAARTLLLVDVPDLLSRIERAHSFGAVLDPTLYREMVEAMDHDKAMLEAALPLWRWAKEFEARAEAARKGGA